MNVRFTKDEMEFMISACKQCLPHVEESGIAQHFLVDLILKCGLRIKEIEDKNKSQ